MREALAWPTHGHPLMLCAHGVVACSAPGSPFVGCQNQYVGMSSVFPSGPSCMVMPCSSVGWKYLPMPSSFGGLHPLGSVELGGGPSFVYSVAPFFAAQGFFVISMSIRGWGGSELDDDDASFYAAEHLAADVVAVPEPAPASPNADLNVKISLSSSDCVSVRTGSADFG